METKQRFTEKTGIAHLGISKQEKEGKDMVWLHCFVFTKK